MNSYFQKEGNLLPRLTMIQKSNSADVVYRASLWKSICEHLETRRRGALGSKPLGIEIVSGRNYDRPGSSE